MHKSLETRLWGGKGKFLTVVFALEQGRELCIVKFNAFSLMFLNDMPLVFKSWGFFCITEGRYGQFKGH